MAKLSNSFLSTIREMKYNAIIPYADSLSSKINHLVSCCCDPSRWLWLVVIYMYAIIRTAHVHITMMHIDVITTSKRRTASMFLMWASLWNNKSKTNKQTNKKQNKKENNIKWTPKFITWWSLLELSSLHPPSLVKSLRLTWWLGTSRFYLKMSCRNLTEI